MVRRMWSCFHRRSTTPSLQWTPPTRLRRVGAGTSVPRSGPGHAIRHSPVVDRALISLVRTPVRWLACTMHRRS